MIVPIGAAPDLNEAHALFQKTPGNQTASPEILGVLLVQAIEFPGRLRFLGDIEDSGDAELHPGGQLVSSNAGFEPRIALPVG